MSIETLKNENSINEELNEFFTKEIREIVNSVPEMNENEIKQLTGSQLYNIFSESDKRTYVDSYGTYIIVNLKNKKRKLYCTLGKPLKNGHTYISTELIEDYNIGIGRKVGNKIIGIYADIEENCAKNIHNGDLKYENGEFKPKK